MNKFTFAYIAGYFDGDGCFSCRQEKDLARIKIQVTSTNFKILSFFKKKFGGHIYHRKQKPEHSHWKNQYCYCLHGIKCLPIINNIIPFLVEKQKEAKILLDFYKTSNNEIRNHLCKIMKETKKSGLVTKNDKNIIYNNKLTINPTKYDFAYLAGFIDAECSFRIINSGKRHHKNNTYKINLVCNNTKVIIFYWLMERFGGNLYYVSRNVKEKFHNDQFQWYISSKALFAFLPKIISYLKFKKPVAKKLIEFQNTILPVGGDRQSKKFKDLCKSILSKRESIIQKVHFLNLKGS